MMEYANDDRAPYQVAVYNKEVRALVKDNSSHDYFNDQWADTHYHEVLARNEDEARTIMLGKFPTEDGFVIEAVVRERWQDIPV